MRKRIFEIIEASNGNDTLSSIYDWSMIAFILSSLIPLAFKTNNQYFNIIDQITVIVFIIDYLFRFLTADFKLKRKAFSFLIYPFTPLAIIDILSILPSIIVVNQGLRMLKIFRLLRALKVFRTLKFFRYSSDFQTIVNVLKKQKKILFSVAVVAIAYILISALVVFNVEPESFNSFFDAIYWATVSLTTVGYGDIYPVSTIGRIVTMLSSIFGIAIIALPSGIVTAGYLEEIKNKNQDEERNNN